jgi:hypothetical protein
MLDQIYWGIRTHQPLEFSNFLTNLNSTSNWLVSILFLDFLSDFLKLKTLQIPQQGNFYNISLKFIEKLVTIFVIGFFENSHFH